MGVHGASAITSVTAQNPSTVLAQEAVSTHLLSAQIQATRNAFPVGAVKTGMLSNAALVTTVAHHLRDLPATPWVCDPVFIATSGAALLDDDGYAALVDALPLATLTTPNVPEASRLTNTSIDSVDTMWAAARAFTRRFGGGVLIKGGHAPWNPDALDVYVGPEGEHAFRAARLPDRNVHGTGCALSAAIAARLCLGSDLLNAIEHAKSFLWRAIESAYPIGKSAHLALALDFSESVD